MPTFGLGSPLPTKVPRATPVRYTICTHGIDPSGTESFGEADGASEPAEVRTPGGGTAAPIRVVAGSPALGCAGSWSGARVRKTRLLGVQDIGAGWAQFP